MKSWLRHRVESALRNGFMRAYETVKVDPDNFRLQLRTGYGLPISTFDGVFSVPVEQLDDVALNIIRASQKLAAVEGAGLGLGGIFTILPDLGILAGITIRTIQKLSLLYGFQFTTEDEQSELWVAAATAAGVDVGRELVERQVVRRFVPRVINAIAAQAGKEVAEKIAGRVVPILSSAIGATLNYYFIRAWGERAMLHFRARHLAARQQREHTIDAPVFGALPPGP
ncbi:MAG TPA: EcsC family protein [Terriglobales bacterium]